MSQKKAYANRPSCHNWQFVVTSFLFGYADSTQEACVESYCGHLFLQDELVAVQTNIDGRKCVTIYEGPATQTITSRHDAYLAVVNSLKHHAQMLNMDTILVPPPLAVPTLPYADDNTKDRWLK